MVKCVNCGLEDLSINMAGCEICGKPLCNPCYDNGEICKECNDKKLLKIMAKIAIARAKRMIEYVEDNDNEGLPCPEDFADVPENMSNEDFQRLLDLRRQYDM